MPESYTRASKSFQCTQHGNEMDVRAGPLGDNFSLHRTIQRNG